MREVLCGEVRASVADAGHLLMTKKDAQLLWGLFAVGATLYFMRNPRCNSGCQTLLAHLLTHELDLLL